MRPWEKFAKVQAANFDFGACDSEAGWVAESYVRRLFSSLACGEPAPAIPTTPVQWQLYVHSMKCDSAAAALTKALKVLVKDLFFEGLSGGQVFLAIPK